VSADIPRIFGCAPTADALDQLARQVLAAIPAPFADHLPEIVFRVEEFPDDAVLADLGAESPYDITGLYHGIPVGDRDGLTLADGPDMIFLYRQPLLSEWCESGEALEDIITHLIIHEVGHHFGLSDDDMERIEDSA
jgi:predicted Zn-dependent protease with MMP-like domain